MPECQNCGAHVTDDYVRVFEPAGTTEPRCCPNCEDLIRDGPDVRNARAKRQGNGKDPVSYDSDLATDGGQS
ncbi:hypothetical protein RBH20_10030 [Haloarcula sp. H-GB4]|uniref:DUF7563 family protein n=1 Tax=Haloarcula sp. H-GB4 TaxID=3069755 RepID=UPI0027B3EEFA|nr:hypothetical protein [Haloarcula sp. H-GB4]MDQ2072869.1 hypothetical protein [Haloarcula sp. H-GB4]